MARQSLLSTLLGHEVRDPFGDLTNEFERMIGRMRSAPVHGTAFERTERALAPRADIAETDTAVRIEMDLPGVTADQLEVELIDQALTISGTRHTESEHDENDYHIVERSHGEFRRRLPLGFEVDDGAVHADFADGVLTIVIDKPPESRVAPKRITVNGKVAPAKAAEASEPA